VALNTNDRRKVFLLAENGERKQIEFSELKKGDRFVLEESDGTPVNNGMICRAIRDPITHEGVPTIQVEEDSGPLDTQRSSDA
jgi:hypothetical protein